MKKLIYICIVLFTSSILAQNYLSAWHGCPKNEFESERNFTPWKSEGSCISREEVLENMHTYIMRCGLLDVSIPEGQDTYSVDGLDESLASLNIFEYDSLYGRYFLGSESYSIDLKIALEKFFSREEGWEGTVLISPALRSDYSWSVKNGKPPIILYPSCEGRVYEVVSQ